MEERALAGIRVSVVRRDTVVGAVERALDSRRSLRLTFLNPDYARRALLDDQLLADINSFDAVLVDGNGVRLLCPVFGFTVPERVDTDSLAPALFSLLARRGAGVYLFGCAPGVAETAARRLESDIPGLRVVGTVHGYHDVQAGHPGRYSDSDTDAVIEAINASGAELVVVSLPTPLQQRWVASHGVRLEAPVVMTAGSYLDHVAEAGTGAWYPRWADALRLNWLYRLGREPRRLWRRYTVESAELAVMVVGARLRGGRRPRD